MKTAEKNHRPELCHKYVQGIKDAQDLMGGKWRMIIVAALYYNGCMRFMDLQRHIGTIAPKVLSSELKDLELNQILKRTVYDTKPVTVEYELLPLGNSLSQVIGAFGKWGMHYREALLQKA
jgi:DNA-binding HxlR family transcriptional regulator